jgi:hypothetical protein
LPFRAKRAITSLGDNLCRKWRISGIIALICALGFDRGENRSIPAHFEAIPEAPV